MSTQTMPQIPPRPTREKDQPSSGATLGSDIPKIPPRPARRIERSQSPPRESFARSPLNDYPGSHSNGKTSIYHNMSANASIQDLPARPPSVTLPSLGQEGDEYAAAFEPVQDLSSSPTQSRNIANDLKLHAPKPSLPATSAKQRISTVTRTDSGQAAALGIGKAQSETPAAPSLKKKTSSISVSSSGTDRRQSMAFDEEHGIPEIGQRVPMYPNAGDVQAPSPSPMSSHFPAGVGFHNDGSKPRHHGRRSSGKGFEGPPGSYGLHGHGQMHNDRFEKAYYEKHPELVKKETGHYSGVLGDGRGEWALSSEDLNRIVRDTASRGSGLGSSSNLVSTPSEQIGFLATEEYASRQQSPRPDSKHKKAPSVSSQTHVDSPLRKENNQHDSGSGNDEFVAKLKQGLKAPSAAVDSEVDDDDVVHVDAPDHHPSKIYSGEAPYESAENLGYHGAEEEHGYSAPILASDEVAKEPFGYELQPAVSPNQERRSMDNDGYPHYLRSSSAASSRPTSRPGSIHGLSRFDSDYNHSTPLEDLAEYEPLFSEEELKNRERPLTAADKFKRPDLKNKKFPSQDIWEDTPDSLHYTATVSTPQLPEDNEDAPHRKQNIQPREGETMAEAFARKQEELAEQESKDSESFLNREKKPWAHKSILAMKEENRPGLKQRFPSRDIWEDNPDSLNLQTTVGGPQTPEAETLSAPTERPTTGAVVFHQELSASGVKLGSGDGRATTGLAATFAKPSIPARPTKIKPKSESASPSSAGTSPTATRDMPFGSKPAIPERSKPVVPARPGKISSKNSSEEVPLSKTISGGSDTSAAAAAAKPKPKPSVPSRPVGSKIAALQGGFMSDLNKRLQLGPQAPKKEEPEEVEEEKEKAPLADARKGRARGPARRAPAKSPAPGIVSVPEASALSFSSTMTFFSIHPEDDELEVPSRDTTTSLEETKAEKSVTPTLATNTAGESLHTPAEIAPDAEKTTSFSSASQDLHAKQSEEAQKDYLTSTNTLSSPIKPSDAPAVSHLGDATDEGDELSASTATIRPAEDDAADSALSAATGPESAKVDVSEDPKESSTNGTTEKIVELLGMKSPEEEDITKEPLGGGEKMPGGFE